MNFQALWQRTLLTQLGNSLIQFYLQRLNELGLEKNTLWRYTLS